MVVVTVGGDWRGCLYTAADIVWLRGDAYAVMAIDPNGQAWPWLLQDDAAATGCACRDCAPHEQHGRLPAAVRARISQCQATTKATGRRCSLPVSPPGRYCHNHRHLNAGA